MSVRYTLGVDIGASGALAFYAAAEPAIVTVDDMPMVAGRVDPHALARRIRQMAPAFAVVEQQGPRPTDGCKQSFGIGHAYAVVTTALALCDVPVHLVTSGTWKKHHKIFGASDPKEAGRALALRLWPQCAETFALKKHDGRSDAALIARFGAETIQL